jgi:hypothetical protein
MRSSIIAELIAMQIEAATSIVQRDQKIKNTVEVMELSDGEILGIGTEILERLMIELMVIENLFY